MMLASELALAGVKVCILERLKETTPYSRALTVHPRTLELFDLRGIKPKFMERGRPVSRGHFAGLETPLDFSVLDSASNYTLIIPQSETEKLLEAWAGSLGVEIRKGRIFLAGDAAHIHFPAGGQGMNVGIQDAVNLGWKLAAAIQGRAPDWLLDSYHAERFPVGTALLRNTEVQTLMFELSPRMVELRSLMAGLLRFPDANRMVSEQIAAFNVRYESDAESPSHPLGGQRAAELELKLADGTACRSYEFFHNGQFVLLQLDVEEGMPFGELWPGSEHVRVVNASLTKANPDWSGVRAALVRPDGYVAWAVAQSDPAPRDSVARGMSRWMKF